MNITRALTVKYGRGSVLSAGRVQTPTLKLIYDRTKENLAHKKSIHYVIKAQIEDSDILLTLDNKKFRKKEEAEKLIENFPDKLPIEMNRRKKIKVPPPLPNLLDIQKNANNKWGYKAEETLNTVQSLYEKYKAVSYPRTDCNFVTANTALKLDKKLSKFEKF
ncbi:DNA topoisomerase [endosymbiont 'TC1' of Trimyema compressum]|uniref:DNA topoisomerase n=1 Tax=endosymbiont 'TC1' of Trimyema compressum TaxID=243899 RepID=UPI000B4D4A2E|nr:DNA topoisomerase [endosymbiont 'TC1' of Trimyema compressum]